MMINDTTARALIFVASLSLLNACDGKPTKSELREQKIIETYNLSPIEAKAFQTCQSQMRKADFTPRQGIRQTRVPAEICACHAPMMVKHFKPGSGSEHALILAYVMGVSTNTSLDINSLIETKQPAKQFEDLVHSLNSCARKTASEQKKTTHDKIQKLCEEGKFGAKKCEQMLAELK